MPEQTTHMSDVQIVESFADTRKAIDAELRKIAQDFEAVFVNLLLKEMRKTVPEGGLLGSDAGAKVYREIMDTAEHQLPPEYRELVQKYYESLSEK